MMCKCGVMFTASVVIVSSLILLVTSFNIDTKNYGQHNGPRDSMFGFSVATYGEPGNSWVLVGAPTAQGERSRIVQGGAVFKCNTTRDDGCQEIDFHQERSQRGKPLDDKNNQWFGATVSTAGPNGPVVACASRYVWFPSTREERRDPVGTCYIGKDDFRTFSEYSPCRTSLFGYHRQGSCQAGFSAGISKDGRRLFVGAPGSWYWQGQMYSIDPSIKYPFTPGLFGEAFGVGTKGQVIQQSLDDRPSVMSTPEGPATDDDSYMGYSMVVGDFNGEGVQGIAVGMPKGGDMLEGKVLLYTWSLTNFVNISGEQMGSYFGYAVATSDVNGDGRDDVIIGAPMHTEKGIKYINHYEVGRVCIVYQLKDGKYSKNNTDYLDGFNSNGRFGLSLSTLGDLNRDGFGDFAVGAPYDGPDKRGAVYIFQGSKDGVIQQYSQVIYAEDVQIGNFYPVATFGFSLAGGFDLDGNDYPDLAVGAYLSDSAYFFRARPVAKVEALVRFLANPKQVKLDQKLCSKPGAPYIKVTCTPIEVCMKYTGAGTPASLVMDLKYTLDVKNHIPGSSRLYMEGSPDKVLKNTLTLYKDAPFNCNLRDNVYLQDQIGDKLTELEIQVNYSLSETWHQSYDRSPRAPLFPIVDLSKPAIVNDSINIFRNCGGDNTCIPDLQLRVKAVQQYLYEVGKPLVLSVKVLNVKEDAYNTILHLHLPEGIRYIGANNTSENPQYKITCTNSWSNRSVIVCDIGNPFVTGSVVEFNVFVEPDQSEERLKAAYNFYMNVSSVNPENATDLADNERTVSVGILVDVTLSIEGQSTPANVYYNISHYENVNVAKEDAEIGPPVIHSYIVTNNGPSDVEGLDIIVVWPVTTLAGEDLLYLLEPVHTIGNVECEAIDATANYKGYALTLLRNVWDTINVANTSEGPRPGVVIETGNKTTGVAGDSITISVTTFKFYDENKTLVEVGTIEGELGSHEFFRNISAIVSKFNGPLTASGIFSNIIIKRDKYGKETRQEIIKTAGPAEEPYLSFKIITDVTTKVTYYLLTGQLEFMEEIDAEPGSETYKLRIANTKERLGKPFNIRTNTTKHIEYVANDGKVLYHHILIQTGTEFSTNNGTSSETVATVVTFYDSHGNVLSKEHLESEPATKEYWDSLNKLIIRYSEPVTVETRVTKTIIYYVGNKEHHREEVPLLSPLAQTRITAEKTASSTIKVISNINGKVLHEITIPTERGTTQYNEEIKNIIRHLKEPIDIHTTTTYTITYRRPDTTILQSETFTEETREPYTPSLIGDTRTVTITTVTLYDSSQNLLQQVNITATPESAAYWEEINRIISGYQQQINFEVDTKTIEIYQVVGQPPRYVQIGGIPKTTLTSHTDVNTEMKIIGLDGQILHQENIRGIRGSPIYNDRLNAIISRHTPPFVISTKTIHVITYKNPGGAVVRSGTFTELHTETYNTHPTEPGHTQTQTITTVIFYDHNRNVLHQANVTDAPGSTAYWEQINKILSGYQQQVTMEVTTRKVITYYVNGLPVRTEPIGGVSSQEGYKSHTNIITEITVTSGDTGVVLYTGTIPGARGSEAYHAYFNNIVSRYTERLMINTKTTYTIEYTRSDGSLVHRGTMIEQHTESYNPLPIGGRDTHTIITVNFYDHNKNVLQHVNITDELESAAYWEQINRIIRGYQQEITIEVSSRRFITQYISGQQITKQIGGVSDEAKLTAHTDISTDITVSSVNTGNMLYTGIIPGQRGSEVYNNYFNNIMSRFREPLVINTKTTYTISYMRVGGGLIHTGKIIEQHTENYNPQTEPTVSPIGDRRTVIITTVTIYDRHRNILQQLNITDQPESAPYWEQINSVISKYEQQQITIITNTRTVVSYYVNGHVISSEEVSGTSGTASLTPHIKAETIITVYDANRQVIYTETIPGTSYKTRVNDISNRFREPITIVARITYSISYRNSQGQVIHTGLKSTEETNTYNQNQGETRRSHTITTITFYGPTGNMLSRETISDEPGSPLYWQHIRNVITRVNTPLNIHTNTSRVITYYINGVETRNEHVAGNAGIYDSPITSRIEINNLITYYDSDKNVLYQEKVAGEFTAEERNRHIADFTNRYGRSFTIETNTTKTVTYSTSDGRILHNDIIPSLRPEDQHLTRTTTKTTFKVYEGSRLVHQETIEGEPGSAAYNNIIADIINRYHGAITIRTNSTKVITFYNSEGRKLDTQYRLEPQSTVHRGSASGHKDATTSITFYGPDGKTIHHDTFSGAPGQELHDQLNQIASRYGGVVKSYAGQLNEDGSVGGLATVVDSPYPGGRPQASGHHFINEFDGVHKRSQDSQGSSLSLQDLNQNLDSFAKGKGFRAGGIAFETADSGNNYESQSYDGSHNGLANYQAHNDRNKVDNNRGGYHNRRKRELDHTDAEIEKLKNCTTSKCIEIKCKTGHLRKGEEVHIALRSRVNVETLKKISVTQPVNIQSRILARVREVEGVSGTPAARTLYRHDVLTSVMAPQPDIKPDIVPLWVVVLSAVAGTLILLLLIFLLYLCGFFKRNRPSDAPERQPLNRNGHFQHGDEAL